MFMVVVAFQSSGVPRVAGAVCFIIMVCVL